MVVSPRLAKVAFGEVATPVTGCSLGLSVFEDANGLGDRTNFKPLARLCGSA